MLVEAIRQSAGSRRSNQPVAYKPDIKKKPLLGRTLARRLASVSVAATVVLGGLWAAKEYVNFSREVERSRAEYDASQRAIVKDITTSVIRYIRLQQNRIDQEAESTVKARANEAIAVADNIYSSLKDELPPDQIRRLIIETWRSMQFRVDKDYLFAFDVAQLTQLPEDELAPENGNLLDRQAGEDRFGVGEIQHEIRRNGTGFDSFLWSASATSGSERQKMAFVLQFHPLSLAVGAGVHVSEVEKRVKRRVINFLGQVTYGEDGYVFATDWDGTSLSGPAAGRNVIDVQDMNGIKVVRELIRLSKQGGGYLTYHIPAETGALPVKKVSYVAGVPDWEWYVGAGFGLEGFERNVDILRQAHARDLATILLIVLSIVALLIMFIVYAARAQSAKVREHHGEFMRFFENAASSRMAIDLDRMRYREFEEIAQAANEMVAIKASIEKNLRESEHRLLLAKEEAERSSRAKSDFLANMSHELRTPLNAIAGFSDMITNQTFGDVGDPRYLEYAGYIRTSGDHLLSIVNDVLDLSKIEAGHFPIAPLIMPLHNALEDAVSLIHFRGNRNRDRIIVDIREDASTVYADPRAFRQILINLISNADKYSPFNGLITVRSRACDDGAVIIEIEDEGVGIAPQDLAQVLEPFGQARRDAHVTHEGTGLGLSLSKSLMELHGGTLEISSEPAKGTIVRLTFPAMQA
jgi:signal transduction histidine kinase